MAQGPVAQTAWEAAGFLPERRPITTRLLHIAAKKPLGAVALIIILSIWTVCLLAPVLAPYAWDELFTGEKLSGPTTEGGHLFGTDNTGRDVLSRVLYGGRLTLITSLAATAGGIALASLFGIVSGYVLGLYDLIFQRLSDGLQALPGLVVLMVVAAVFEQNRWAVIGALMILTAPVGGRVLRSQALSLRNHAYIEAARVIGASPVRILARHMVPNLIPLMIILFTINIGASMLILTSLAFLGVIEPSTPDWGTMLNVAAQQYLVTAPWTAIFPGAAITLSVLSYNLLGDALRDVLDPRLRGT